MRDGGWPAGAVSDQLRPDSPAPELPAATGAETATWRLRVLLMTIGNDRPRTLTLLRGPTAAIRSLALAARPPSDANLWLGGPHDNAPHVNRILGGNLAAAVIDPASGLDANRLGALVGAIEGGGELIWLDANDLPTPSAMAQRCARLLAEDPEVRTMSPAGFAQRAQPSARVVRAADGALAPSPEQTRIASAVVEVLARGAAPVVVMADRGRGKSTALGIAAARALAILPAATRILVTSANRHGAEHLLAQARAAHPEPGLDHGVAQGANRDLALATDRLHYAPVEAVLAMPAAPLLIDEAASLPVATLTDLLRQHPRTAMATTVQGYEGTGQGFRINFAPALDRLHPSWRLLRLSKAMRHRDQDVVERAGLRFMGFSLPAQRTDPPLHATTEPADDKHPPRCITAAQLLADETALLGVFELLRSAHYRTRPGDLARMLDDDQVRVWCHGHPQAPSSCAITIDEGGLDEELAAAMVRGERRPRGHLGAGVFAERLGIAAGARMASVRINRIAVIPGLRRRGIGRDLVNAIASDAAARGAAMLTSSFGATSELLDFWRRSGLEVLRLGQRRERSTGLFAAFAARALDLQGNEVLAAARVGHADGAPSSADSTISGRTPQGRAP